MPASVYPLCARADALVEHYKTAAELLAHPSTGFSTEQAISMTLRFHFLKAGMGESFKELANGIFDGPINFHKETK